MAKDKMMQDQRWERKKEKMDRKKQTERGNTRTVEKADKRDHKKVMEDKLKSQQNQVKLPWSAELKVLGFQGSAAVVIAGFYLTAMMQSTVSNAVITAVAAVALVAVAVAGSQWRQALLREAEHKEVAGSIVGHLEQAQREKEREQRMKEWRLLQIKRVKEQQRRRAEEEAKALQQAKEVAQLCRQRREQREAEERREAEQARLQPMQPGAGDRDEHGWAPAEKQQLREAVANCPESATHSRRKRWEMIASTVDGRDARACEETFARLEEEAARARAAAAEAKAERRRAQASATGTTGGLEDDMDWMGGATDAAAGGGWSDGEEDEEEEDDVGEGRERMAVEIEPQHKGTEIRLDGIKTMQGCATVQVEVLHLQVTCADCRVSTRLFLSGADEDAADAKTWCEGCSGLISVRLRPTLMHQSSTRLCYVDCVRCSVTDLLPSVLMSVCAACDAANVHKQEFVRNRLVTGTCQSCHSKYAFAAQSVQIEQVTPCDPGTGRRSGKQQSPGDGGSGDPMDEIEEELKYLRKKAKSDPKQQLIKLGSPLPQMGACSHFKQSYKWYRFGCCGRAFPCPECHALSGCPAAALGAHANRMICGKCSMEQGYSPAKPCEKCGFIMQARGTSHWDDGSGTRNLAMMSTKDAKKFKGGLRQATSKFKTSSNKATRVGAKAKAQREHVKKFGKDG